MIPKRIYIKASQKLNCTHPFEDIVIEDVYKINPVAYECVALCPICGRATYIDVSRKEYNQIRSDDLTNRTNHHN